MERIMKEVAKELKLIRKELEKSNKLSIDRETDSEKLRRGINNLGINNLGISRDVSK